MFGDINKLINEFEMINIEVTNIVVALNPVINVYVDATKIIAKNILKMFLFKDSITYFLNILFIWSISNM